MSEEAITPEAAPKVDEALPSEWVDTLPDKIKDAPFFRPTKDGTVRTVDEVFSALENAAKLQGNLSESHIKIPSPDAGDEDKAKARERILALWPDELREVKEGEDTVAPEDHTGYKVPEGAEGIDAAQLEDIAKFAHAHQWGQQQFADYAARMIASNESAVEGVTQWETEQAGKLTERLGEAKDVHLARVASAIEQAGAAPEYVEALKSGKIDAELVMVMDNLVGRIIDMGDEGSQFVQQVNTDARPMTPEEHRDRVWELRASLKDVQKSDPLYRKVTQKIQDHIGLSLNS
jgi:hypothetical protein